MFRFFAIAWNGSRSDESESARLIERRLRCDRELWRLAFADKGLRVFVRGSQSETQGIYPLYGHGGVVVGTLFESSGEVRGVGRECDCIGSQRSLSSLMRTKGRSVTRDYWGSFILFLQNHANRETHVVRSPMSSLPCFYSNYRNVQLIYSRVDDCIGLRLVKFSIDWESICAQACNQDYLTRETAIQEISSLETGECLNVCNSKITTQSYWNPCDIARQGAVLDFSEAVSRIRRSTRTSVAAWASGHDSILVSLSGGLDSAIVLSCLSEARPRPAICCINNYSRHPVGDEREFARSMTDRAGVRLVETELDGQVDLSQYLNCVRGARPVLDYTGFNRHVHSQLAREVNATAIFSGELGDNVFGYTVGHEQVAEFVWRNGITRDLLTVAMDFARLRHQSIWGVLGRAIRDGMCNFRRRNWSMREYIRELMGSDQASASLVSVDAIQRSRAGGSRFLHPWFQDVAGVPPGKILLIYGLFVVSATVQHMPFADPDGAEIVSPLSSQPLVEEALRIASYLNVRNGVDRSVARTAFRNDLSPLVLRRQGKGTVNFWIKQITRANRRFLRELFLDGVLVKNGILDSSRIEGLLADEVQTSRVSLPELYIQFYIEIWLRRWMGSEVEPVPI